LPENQKYALSGLASESLSQSRSGIAISWKTGRDIESDCDPDTDNAFTAALSGSSPKALTLPEDTYFDPDTDSDPDVDFFWYFDGRGIQTAARLFFPADFCQKLVGIFPDDPIQNFNVLRFQGHDGAIPQ